LREMFVLLTVASCLGAYLSPPPGVQRQSGGRLELPAAAQQLIAVGSAVLITACSAGPALAAEVMTTPQCLISCNQECNALAPGNKGYCATQCDDFCESLDPVASGAVVASDASKDCSGYKTDKAKEYCEAENAKAVAPRAPAGKDLGIFGDSGVSYSKGVEDLFATAFGATRQNKNLNEADVGAFASDIGGAAFKAAFGK